jgi:hypothetical protein
MIDYAILFSLVAILFYSTYSSVKKSKYRISTEIKDAEHLYGDLGERLVARELRKLSDEYRVKNSVEEMIYVGKYQIDHVVVNDNRRIIYVIETKYWNGRLKGYKDDNWYVEVNGEKKYYGNPVIQNQLHCNAVKKKYRKYRVESIVVFANDNVSWQCKCHNIIRVDYLVDYIENDMRRKMAS